MGISARTCDSSPVWARISKNPHPEETLFHSHRILSAELLQLNPPFRAENEQSPDLCKSLLLVKEETTFSEYLQNAPTWQQFDVFPRAMRKCKDVSWPAKLKLWGNYLMLLGFYCNIHVCRYPGIYMICFYCSNWNTIQDFQPNYQKHH